MLLAVKPAAISAASTPVFVATARSTFFSLSVRRCARMFCSRVLRPALSVRRYATIWASVRSAAAVVAVVPMAVRTDCATARSAFISAFRNSAT